MSPCYASKKIVSSEQRKMRTAALFVTFEKDVEGMFSKLETKIIIMGQFELRLNGFVNLKSKENDLLLELNIFSS